MEYIEADPLQLDCTNNVGLCLGFEGREDKLTSKLVRYQFGPKDQPNYGTGLIDLVENPKDPSRLIILDGHHRGFSAYVFQEQINGRVHDNKEGIEDDIARVNYDKALTLHNLANVMGYGKIPNLLDEKSFKMYVKRLNLMKNGDNIFPKIIQTMEEFWRKAS